MRKELLITKRILAGVAAGFVLFIYAAIPSMAKQINAEDDPRVYEDVPYTNSSGETTYLEMGGWDSELWAEQPFDAYWHNEAGGETSNDKYGKKQRWMSVDMYYSGYGNDKVTLDGVHGAFGRQVYMGVFLSTDHEWEITRTEESTNGNVVNITYQINAHTGDVVEVRGYSSASATAWGVGLESQNTNKRFVAKNDPEYDSEWTIEPNEVFAFYNNIHAARKEGKWLDGAEDYNWPDENGDACIAGLLYTIQGDEDVVYADSLAKVKFDNKYTGEQVNAEITYRYKIINLDNVNSDVATDTSSALNTAGEDEGTDIGTDIVEGDNFQYKDESDDDTWPDISELTGDFENPFESVFEDFDDEDLPKVIGTGAAGAAIAAGALGSSDKGKDEDKKKKKEKKKKEKKEDRRSTYKMFVYKDFGDTLKRGDDSKYVYARIEETTWDKRVFTNEKLTQQISVSSPDDALIVSDAGMTTNGYKAAKVDVPVEGNKIKGTVSFMFAGEGGIYTRNVVFNIVGEKPYIIYPRIADDGVSWRESNQPGVAVLIAGKGGTEKVRFYIKDAVDEPIDIRFDCGPDFNVSYEKEAAYKCGYYAVVENCSPEIEKANGIIADVVTKTISVEAEFKDGTITNSEFYVELYPDGLSVVPNTKYFKDDIFQVITVAEDDPKPGEISIMPSSFDVLVCYVDSFTAETKIFRNPSIRCEKPDDEGRYGNTFKENFEYWIDYTTSGGYDFYPKCTLPMFGKPYDAKMKLTYNGKGGTRFEGELPIQFWGEIPKPPSEATRREEELKLLKKAIQEYGVGSSESLKIMLSNIEYYSASDIRFVRNYVLLLGVRFYSEESRVNVEFGDLCDKYVVVSSALVKAGDYAVQVILEVKFGANGKIAAAIINPFKNMLCEYIGQYIGLGAEPGSDIDVDPFFKVATGAVRDAIGEVLTGEKKPDPEVMGYVVAAYLMYSFANHYYYGSDKVKGDVYRSVLAAVGDLSLTYFKSWLSEQVEETLKGLKLKEFGEWVAKKLDGFFGGITQKAMKAAGDKAFEKGIRSQIEGGIGYTEYALAKTSKEFAQDNAKKAMEMFLYYTDETTADAITKVANISLAAICNYFLYGVLEEDPEDADALGGSLEDITVEAITKLLALLGLKPENVYKVAQLTNGVSSVKVDLTSITVVWFGYSIKIDIVKNLKALFEMLYNFCFYWMNAIFNDPGPDPSTFPDYRDRLDDNLEILDDTLRKLEGSVDVHKV
ncbi:hypothetical protein [Butyrivibrio sp. FCS006]|uniref:hypothetical protein n=1 Tax=Butyrivibrio sp. FCS006 TaxID=1280684 RepID=UPI0003FD1A65|nr:hypothetical protein [Butyrivibrio sp. FCS006]